MFIKFRCKLPFIVGYKQIIIIIYTFFHAIVLIPLTAGNTFIPLLFQCDCDRVENVSCLLFWDARVLLLLLFMMIMLMMM